MTHLSVEGLVLYIAAFAALLWWLFLYEYRHYRTAKLRHTLFQIRDELFAVAKAGGYFGAPAYCLTRTTLNGMIRFAHETCLAELLVFVVLNIRRRKETTALAREYLEQLNRDLDQLPMEVKKKVAEVHIEMHRAILVHVLRTSILIGPIFLLTFWIVEAVKQAEKVYKFLLNSEHSREGWAILDAEANKLGNALQAT